MDPDWRRICDRYMKATSYSPEEMGVWKDRSYDRDNRHETYLTHPDAEARIDLGPPRFPESDRRSNLWEALRQRRSRRNFLEAPLTLNQLNLLLWATQGITADMGPYQLRTAPSSGALYPTETYLLVDRVEGLDPGLYHLSVQDWHLERLRTDSEVAERAQEIAYGQEMARIAAVNFVWTTVIERCREKYHERAYRYIWWDVGIIAENLYLAGEALGLGVCSAGAWFDSVAHQYLGIDGVEHLSVLFASVGRVEGRDWLADRRAPPR